MRAIIKYILIMVMTTLFVSMTSSCVCDDRTEEPDTPQDDPMLVLNIKLPMMRSTRAADGTYEAGTGYENYINITSDDSRIYLFDKDNKFLLQFIPMMLSPSAGESSDTYTAVGKVPAEMESLTNFKIVVLANWPNYPAADKLIKGTTTIDDLCKAETALFDCLIEEDKKEPGRWNSCELNPDKGRVIPFFGVHEYSGVTFVKGKRTTLSEPVTLLRAMAKIEVIFDNPGLSLEDVILHGFNSKGYCAPTGVSVKGDYDHDGQWGADYVKTLHLIDDANDADAKNKTTHLFCKSRGDGEQQKETWVCYVPEYKNTLNGDGTGPANDRAWLELKLDIPGITLENVYFTEYDANTHKSLPNTDFDLHRNNCYRFNVSLGKGGLIIRVQKWENTYDNNFTFE